MYAISLSELLDSFSHSIVFIIHSKITKMITLFNKYI